MSKIDEIMFEQLRRIYESTTINLYQEMGQMAQTVNVTDQAILPGTELEIATVGVEQETVQELVKSFQIPKIRDIPFEESASLHKSLPQRMSEPVARIARKIVIPNKKKISRTEIEDTGIDENNIQAILKFLQEKGVIAEQEDQIHVRNADFFGYTHAHNVVLAEHLESLNSQQISERILAFEREIQDNALVPVTCLLLVLVNHHRCTSFWNTLVTPQNSNWTVLGCFANALPLIRLDVDRYLELVAMLEKAFGRNMSGGSLYEGLQATGKKNPEYVWQIIEQIQNSIEDGWNYLPSFISGIVQNKAEFGRCYTTVQQWIS